MPVIYNRLPKIAAGAEAKAIESVAKVAYDTEALAKFNAPVDTGNLRATISTSAVRHLTWRVQANADYALYVEMGTSRMSGRWYLTNALRQSYAALQQQILRGLLG